MTNNKTINEDREYYLQYHLKKDIEAVYKGINQILNSLSPDNSDSHEGTYEKLLTLQNEISNRYNLGGLSFMDFYLELVKLRSEKERNAERKKRELTDDQ